MDLVSSFQDFCQHFISICSTRVCTFTPSDVLSNSSLLINMFNTVLTSSWDDLEKTLIRCFLAETKLVTSQNASNTFRRPPTGSNDRRVLRLRHRVNTNALWAPAHKSKQTSPLHCSRCVVRYASLSRVLRRYQRCWFESSAMNVKLAAWSFYSVNYRYAFPLYFSATLRLQPVLKMKLI